LRETKKAGTFDRREPAGVDLRRLSMDGREQGLQEEEEGIRWEMEMAKKYLDIAGVIIVALNKKGEVTLINGRGCEILGCREKDVVGRKWFEHFLPPHSRESVREVFDRLVSGRGEPVVHHDNPVMTRDKGERVIAWHNMVLRSSSGEVIGVLSSGEDITERKRAEEALRESEERYKTLVQTSPDAVTATDLNGKITFVSPQTLDLHGYADPEELLGRNAFDLIDPEDRAKAILNMKKTLKEGSVKNVEFRLLKKDGSSFIGEMNSAVVREEDGTPRMFIATTRDVSQRKEVEEELRASIRDKELLLQEIHHRVKNNLQVISSLLDLSGLRLGDRRARGLIADARSKIQTMAFIHSQLYRSARFDEIDMGEHVRRLVGYLLSVYAKGKDIQVDIRVPELILPITQAIPCALVLNELISNAFKHGFREQKEGNLEIAIKVTGGDRVVLRVRNDGRGMGPEVDIHRTETLGLKLVRNLVLKQLKGRIKVRRKQYTEFTVEFRKAGGREG